MHIPVETAVVLSNIFIFSSIGIYLYYRSEILFSGLDISSFNRRRLALCLIFLCFYMAIMSFYPCYNGFNTFGQFCLASFFHLLRSGVFVFLPVLVITYVQRRLEDRGITLFKRHLIIVACIFVFLTSTNIWM